MLATGGGCGIRLGSTGEDSCDEIDECVSCLELSPERVRVGRNASGGAGRGPAERCWLLSASAVADGGRGPPGGSWDEMDDGLTCPSADAIVELESARGGLLGVGAGIGSDCCLSASNRLYEICLFLRPLSRLKMMARMSGRYRLSVSCEGSSARARSRISRRSRGTESRSLGKEVRSNSVCILLQGSHAVDMPTRRNAATHSSKPLPSRT